LRPSLAVYWSDRVPFSMFIAQGSRVSRDETHTYLSLALISKSWEGG
jgi:hypothetical protein